MLKMHRFGKFKEISLFTQKLVITEVIIIVLGQGFNRKDRSWSTWQALLTLQLKVQLFEKNCFGRKQMKMIFAWLLDGPSWLDMLDYVCEIASSLFIYSSVPNRRACTFINFEKKIPPARPYFALHVYCFWEKKSPCTFIFLHL